MDGIVHFGMPKTGSTSIQLTLSKLAKKRKANFAFLTLDGDVSANQVVRVLGNTDVRQRRRPVHPDDRLGDIDVEKARVYGELEKQIKAGAGKTVIFSSEVASSIPEDELATLRGQFVSAGLSPRAIGYMRSPKSYMESVFQQRIKGGLNEFSMDPLFPKYRRAYERFDKVFGAEHVEFFLFDSSRFLNGCVVQDFARHTGITVAPDQIRRVNDSLSLPALQLLYAYRKFGAAYGDNINTVGNQRLIDRLRDLEGGKLRLHSSIIIPSLHRFREHIDWVEQRLGASFDEDPTAHDATAVCSEEEMLTFPSESLQWLSQQIAGDPLAEAVLSGEPEAVAKGMHVLYNKALKGKADMSRTQAQRLRHQAEQQGALKVGVQRVLKPLDKLLGGLWRNIKPAKSSSQQIDQNTPGIDAESRLITKPDPINKNL